MTEPTPRLQSVTDALNTAGFGPGSSAGFHVDPAILHDVSQSLANTALTLITALSNAGYVQVPVCGPDPVSKPAADGLNAKITPVMRESHAFTSNLRAAAEQLAQQATNYTATDQHAQSLFDGLHLKQP